MRLLNTAVVPTSLSGIGVEYGMKKGPKVFQDLKRNFMTTLKFHPSDGETCGLDVGAEFLGSRKCQNGIVRPMALKHRKTLSIG
jgi:hypothetical protein